MKIHSKQQCYFLQWTPSTVKATFGEGLLPVHWDRADQSLPAGCKGDEDGWLSLKGVLYLPQTKKFSDSFKFYILPLCLYLCSEYLFHLPFTTFIMKVSNQLRVQNSIIYNSVNRWIGGKDVPWIHLEKTQLSNLTLLIIHTHVSFIHLDYPSFLQAFSMLFILHLQKPMYF